MAFLGTSVFWVVSISVIISLSLMTLIGRFCLLGLPFKLKAPALFYLSPALGLAIFSILASYIGRFLPLGNTVFLPITIFGLLISALLLERHPIQALSHSIKIGIFGLICGVSLLFPLFLYGAFNVHNDAFTYLTHSNWLQSHAFNEILTPTSITPLTTQIAMYQQGGLRMGASFLLAFFQSLLNLSWSYEVYPSLAITAITCCCLALGFPLKKILLSFSYRSRLLLLSLPALGLGGIVFGANLGFLPQTVGLALGVSLLLLFGSTLKWLRFSKPTVQAVFKASIPVTLLFVALTFTYSELIPFTTFAILISSLIMMFCFKIWKQIFLYGFLIIIASLLLLNVELMRTYQALWSQSHAVVGTPVDWKLIGYVAHAFGFHGGAWDGFQWAHQTSRISFSLVLGIATLIFSLLSITFQYRKLARLIQEGTLLPLIIIIVLFIIALIYFRYGVSSPFANGIGQSWSQFKISEWANPFVMVLLIFSLSTISHKTTNFSHTWVVSLFLISIISTLYTSKVRVQSFVAYYGGTHNLQHLYLELRRQVFQTCPPGAPIYLALNGEHHKFREMMAYYLPDRDVHSNWKDDGYIFPSLPNEKHVQPLTKSSCVIESNNSHWVARGKKIGPFTIGLVDKSGSMQITTTQASYDRESDGRNYWYWIEKEIHFKSESFNIGKEISKIVLSFEYGTSYCQIWCTALGSLPVRLFNNPHSVFKFNVVNNKC